MVLCKLGRYRDILPLIGTRNCTYGRRASYRGRGSIDSVHFFFRVSPMRICCCTVRERLPRCEHVLHTDLCLRIGTPRALPPAVKMDVEALSMPVSLLQRIVPLLPVSSLQQAYNCQPAVAVLSAEKGPLRLVRLLSGGLLHSVICPLRS